jgi:exopolyphosphatase/guanosine-5'-triphosphate,3'-diphosphate pyrophosphatase
MSQTYAAADIGSNTVHLLVARFDPKGRLQRIENDSVWLSLGEIVSRHGEIPASHVPELAATIKRFRDLARSRGADWLYVFATEAVRRAANHEAAMREIEDQAGIEVDLIAPEREAALGLAGVLLDLPLKGRFLLAETGGGSMQVAACDGPEIEWSVSMPLGTGVLIEQAQVTQPCPPGSQARLRRIIDDEFAVLGSSERRPVAVCGGVARGLWRALHPDGDRRLHREELRFLAWDAARLDAPTIVRRYSVKVKRAATLFPGALVYHKLLDWARQESMTVSEYGVREGAVLQMAQGKVAACRP